MNGRCLSQVSQNGTLATARGSQWDVTPVPDGLIRRNASQLLRIWKILDLGTAFALQGVSPTQA